MSTLRSCNATSKAFRLVAQRYLFKEIDIGINSKKELVLARSQHLLEVFLKSPGAALTVKELRLAFVVDGSSGISETRLLLEMMPNIEWLFLISVEQQDSRMLDLKPMPSRCQLDLKIRSGIEQLLRQDRLAHLRVFEINGFPLDMLHICQGNCQTLHITDLGRQEEETRAADESSWLHSRNSALKRCDISEDLGKDLNFIMKELLQYSLPQISDLRIKCNHSRHLDVTLMQQLIDHVSPSLRTFDLDVNGSLGTISLSRATRLSELSLTRVEFVSPEEAISWILRVLDTIQRTHTLKVLKLRIGAGILEDLGLAELSHELTSSPSLSGCFIHLSVDNHNRLQEDFDKVLVTYMWSLMQRPQTSIYEQGWCRVDLEALRARVSRNYAIMPINYQIAS